MARKEKKRISVWNWMGSLLLSAIPGVNIIAWILFIIFAKNQSKRNFAIACIILVLLFGVLVCAAFLVFPLELAQLADELRGVSGTVPTVFQ